MKTYKHIQTKSLSKNIQRLLLPLCCLVALLLIGLQDIDGQQCICKPPYGGYETPGYGGPPHDGYPSQSSITPPGTQYLYISSSLGPLPDYRSLATATCNCGPPTLTQNPPPGTMIGVGAYQVTIFLAGGSCNPQSCSFIVNVIYNTGTIPTFSQWGIIIFALLLLAVGMVSLQRKQVQLAIAGGENTNTKPSSFDKSLYFKVFGIVLLLAVTCLAASCLFSGTVSKTDLSGTLVSAGIVAYMVQLCILMYKK